MSQLGFGKTNKINESEYYISIINDYAEFNDTNSKYALWSNLSSLSMDFRGLGLPNDQYLQFSNLMSSITKGQSDCVIRKSGYCILSKSCQEYTASELWDYEFKIQFSDSTNYLRVPLSTFAADST